MNWVWYAFLSFWDCPMFIELYFYIRIYSLSCYQMKDRSSLHLNWYELNLTSSFVFCSLFYNEVVLLSWNYFNFFSILWNLTSQICYYFLFSEGESPFLERLPSVSCYFRLESWLKIHLNFLQLFLLFQLYSFS